MAMQLSERLFSKRRLGALLASLVAVCVFPATALGGAAETPIFGGPYAVLSHGMKGPYEWRISTSPMNRQRKQSLPCINVSVERELRPISEAEVFMSCGTVKPFPTVTRVAAGTGSKKVTVVGMAFGQDVRRVDVSLSDGRVVKRRPRIIGSYIRDKARVKPFAFLVFAVARGLSIGRIVGYDRGGLPITGRLQ